MSAWLMAMFILGSGQMAQAQGAGGDCAVGYYRMADGTGLDIGPSGEVNLRWRRPDGVSGLLTRGADGAWKSTLGWTGRDDGVAVDLTRCAKGEVRINGKAGRRQPLVVTETRFDSAGVELAGRLVMPRGQGRVPIVVLVHGSEDSSARRFYALQRMLPAQGVGVFVYDKRGTGDSKGVFTHDLNVLAADAVAAMRKARNLAGRRESRIGYYGTSQGGWTAPLAASLAPVDFVIVGYGLAVSPLDEDREALAIDMSRHGFGGDETRKALEVGAAAEAIVRSGFQAGYEDLQRVRDRYRGEPWLAFVRGNVTGIVVDTPPDVLRVQGPRLFNGVIADYDPMPVLRGLATPQLWILGGEDIDAPSAETVRRLEALKIQGRPISLVIYPHVEHGLYAFETRGEERLSTTQPPSLIPLIRGYAMGRPLGHRYDDARVVP